MRGHPPVWVLLLCLTASMSDANNECNCTCADGPLSDGCSACSDGDSGSCPQHTCWYQLINNGCAASRIQNGVYQTLANCCAEWVSTAFDAVSEYIIVNGIMYYKNYVTKTLDPYAPSLSPQMPFPGLDSTSMASYDNTTCAGRCCRRAMLITEPSRTPGCADNWKNCVSETADADRLPACTNATAESNCLVWVPCDPNDRYDFWIACVIFTCMGLLPTMTSCFVKGYAPDPFTAYKLSIIPTRPENERWLPVVPYWVLIVISLLVASDYQQWKASTEVSMQYISYQSCVDYCNGVEDDGYVTRYRFCAENYTAAHAYAIWPADMNPLLSHGGCPNILEIDTNMIFCTTCLAHENDWIHLDQAVVFLLCQCYITWPLIMVAYYACRMKNWCIHNGFESRGVYDACSACGQYACNFLAAAHAGLFVAASFYTAGFTIQYGLFHINTNFSSLSVQSVCTAWIVFDACYGIWFITMGREQESFEFSLEYENMTDLMRTAKRKTTSPPSSDAGSDQDVLSNVRIEQPKQESPTTQNNGGPTLVVTPQAQPSQIVTPQALPQRIVTPPAQPQPATLPKHLRPIILKPLPRQRPIPP